MSGSARMAVSDRPLEAFAGKQEIRKTRASSPVKGKPVKDIVGFARDMMRHARPSVKTVAYTIRRGRQPGRTAANVVSLRIG
jgi:hypothetical protein